MAMEYFCCYHSYLKKCEKLSDQEVGRLFRALLLYSETGETQELSGRESIAFDFIADDIDRAKKNYEDKCRKNAENGKSGGRPKKQSEAKKANGFLESEKSQRKDENKNESESKKESKKKDIYIPSLDEVIEYAESRGRVDLAESFFDYYDAADWHDKNGAVVKNWKQKFISWELNTPKSKQTLQKEQEEAERRKYDYGEHEDGEIEFGWGF